jgi:cyclomaltodextrinase
VPQLTWPHYAIWWQLHPVSFLGAPPTNVTPLPVEHRLARLEPWLDYLVGLGCNGLALGPIFASESHGYDTLDHYRIDPRLGDDEDFARLVGQCQARGVRLLLDGVFNHVGRDFPHFRDVLAYGRASRYANWFRLDFDSPGKSGDGFDYDSFEGHRSLVALNHAEPEVVEYVGDVMTHWLGRGADGWRLDAAYAVPRPFWRAVTDRCRREHPRAWFPGEYIHGDYSSAVTEGGLDSVTQYELWKSIWSSLNDRNFFELAWALRRHNGYCAAMSPLTFVGNHDVTRISTRLTDERHLAHALAVMFTIGGIPTVYAGDEQAFRGTKYERADGDAEIRPAFPPEGPAGLAPFGAPVYRLHQDLIGLRRRHPWLASAQTEMLHLANSALAYRIADPGSGAALVVLLNVADQPFSFPLDLSQGRQVLGSGGETPGRVAAHGWSILQA